MSKQSLTLKIFLAVVLNDLIDGLAQLLMKKGLVEPATFSFNFQNIFFFITHNAGSPLVWAGIFLYAFNFFLWIGILSRIDLSLAVPLGSTAYFVIPVLAVIFLHEKLPAMRWAGIFLIMAGIHFLSKSKSAPSVVPAP